MTTQQLEERLSAIEQELAQVKSLLHQSLQKTAPTSQPEQPWWEKVAGTFPDDAVSAEAERLGREWRDSFKDNAE